MTPDRYANPPISSVSLGKSSRAALENLYAQTSVLLDELRQDGSDAAFISIQDVIDEIPRSTQV